jgi:predicted ATPase
LARACAELRKADDASRCIGEALAQAEATKEQWPATDIHRTAGEIALMLPDSDASKAKAHFEHALAVARVQQARCWELRAALSTARLRPHGASDIGHGVCPPRFMTGSPKTSTR